MRRTQHPFQQQRTDVQAVLRSPVTVAEPVVVAPSPVTGYVMIQQTEAAMGKRISSTERDSGGGVHPGTVRPQEQAHGHRRPDPPGRHRSSSVAFAMTGGMGSQAG